MLSEYRLISNLLFFAKIVEKVGFNQLNNLSNSNGHISIRFLTSSQYRISFYQSDERLNTESRKMSVLVLSDVSMASACYRDRYLASSELADELIL